MPTTAHEPGGQICGGGIDTRRMVVKPKMPRVGRAIVDAMVTGRMTPIILLAVWVNSLGFAGRRNARRALDSNSFM